MKKFIIALIFVCATNYINAQEIPVVIVPTAKYHQELMDILNRKSGDNIIGKKITLTKSMSDLEWHHSIKDAYHILKVNIKCDPGFGLIVYFDQLELPTGSSIRAFSYNHTTRVFYSNDNKHTRSFALPLINSNELTLEARIPLDNIDQFTANVSEIGCIPLSSKGTHGFGDTEPCFVNVNCPDGEPWSKQKRAVVRYTYTEDGEIGNCTGTLVNNTAQDDRNFFLTAQHCAMGASVDELGQAIFYFNYESPNCDNPPNDDGLLDETVVGCTRIAASGDGSDPNGFPDGSDFHLFEINPIPASYNIYYAGWNRNDIGNLSGPGSIIQHPLSDIKKISFVSKFIPSITGSDMEAVTTTTSGGQGGNVEPNSSGSAMFDNNKLVVGTISYGSVGCVIGETDFGAGGKFFYHWDQNGTEDNRKLSVWLDPSNTGVMTFEGKNSGNVGIGQLNQYKSEVIVYPNPANNTIYLGYVKSEKINKVKVLINNISGVLVLENEIYLNEKNVLNRIDISNLKPGMYFITISNLENQFYKSSKFIKL